MPESQGSADLARARGIAHLKRDDWQMAADSFRRAAEASPWVIGNSLEQLINENSLIWWRAPALLVYVEDIDGYRQLCKEMQTQLGESQAWWVAEPLVLLSLLSPDVNDVSELPVQRLGDALDTGMAPQWYRQWGYATRALAAYRSGDCRAAKDWALASQRESDSIGPRTLSYPILALACHGLGDTDGVRDALQETRRLLDSQLVRGPDGQIVGRSAMHADGRVKHEALIAEILLREAEALIEGKPAPSEEPVAAPKPAAARDEAPTLPHPEKPAPAPEKTDG